MKIPNSTKYKQALTIVTKLCKAGYEALLVGGCVRDLLLGQVPKDFDIATSATPEQVEALFPRTIPVGAQFGVMLVLRGKTPFEVATFRTDLEYKDGRHPEGVRFSSPEEDAQRRDFTVNGLFFDPVSGKVIDYVDGRKDLKEKVVRAIGVPKKRFEEDKLRLLRAVRFASTLGFEIEAKTFAAVKRQATDIDQVSPERIREELVKLFTGADPGRGLELLDESKLLSALLPEVQAMKGVEQPPQFHPEGDVFRHTKLVLDGVPNGSPVLAFGALLHDIGKPPTFKVAERIRFDGHDRVGMRMAEKICRRLKFSNSETKDIAELVGNHMTFKDVRQMRVSTLKRFLARETFDEELRLHHADCMASHKDLSNFRFLKRKRRELGKEEIKPDPLINGNDLIKAGYAPGRRMGEILKAVQDQQLEGRLDSAKAAMTWVKKHYAKKEKARA